MAKTKKEIKIDHGMRKEMMEIFDTTYPTLRSALRFLTNTDKAIRMRTYALMHGGILMEAPHELSSSATK